MEGTLTWPQLIFLSTVICASLALGFLAAWRIMVMRKEDRHELRSFYEQRFTILDEKHTDALLVQKTTHELELKALASRLDQVEDFRAGMVVTLQHMEEFRKDVTKRFDELAKSRTDDTRAVNSRLDALFNTLQIRTP